MRAVLTTSEGEAHMTLRLKLLILVAAVIFFAATGVTTVALWREVSQAQELLSCQGAAIASSVAVAAPRWMGPAGALPGAREALLPTLKRALSADGLVRAWVVDREGHVAVCADRTGLGCPEGAPSGFRPSGGAVEAIALLARKGTLEASAPVVQAGAVVGAVRVSYRADEVVAEAHNLAQRAAIVAAIWIFLGLSFGRLLLLRITRPLTRLIQAAERLPAGGEIRVDVEADQELGELVASFNTMAARLRESRQGMQDLIANLNQRVAVATEEGLRAERLATLGGIAAGLAHEMGNSLHVISGFNAVVLRELAPEDPHRPDLEAVMRESSRAAALLQRFLFFARARSARTLAQSIEPALREAVEVVGPAATGAQVTTSLSLEPGLPEVRVDAEVLRQAFVNLCVNAVQAIAATGQAGKLEVRARRWGEGVALEFKDDGPGIPQDVQARIFEPFFTTKDTGTGLGLAIVRQAAEANGGKVEVESAKGQGALFRILLPAAGTAPLPASQGTQGSPSAETAETGVRP
jgi:signal transduction histidine kinase